MMETDRNELILAEILADSGSESDDNTGSSSDDSIEEKSAHFKRYVSKVVTSSTVVPAHAME